MNNYINYFQVMKNISAIFDLKYFKNIPIENKIMKNKMKVYLRKPEK